MCKNFNDCSFCYNEDNCPFEHIGTGDPFCGGFQCKVADCPSTRQCITYEEELSIYLGDM